MPLSNANYGALPGGEMAFVWVTVRLTITHERNTGRLDGHDHFKLFLRSGSGSTYNSAGQIAGARDLEIQAQEQGSIGKNAAGAAPVIPTEI